MQVLFCDSSVQLLINVHLYFLVALVVSPIITFIGLVMLWFCLKRNSPLSSSKSMSFITKILQSMEKFFPGIIDLIDALT